MSETQTTATERPELDAWCRTTAGGETTKVIVGEFWNGPQRIEVDPNDLITDPDAFEQPSTDTDRAGGDSA